MWCGCGVVQSDAGLVVVERSKQLLGVDVGVSLASGQKCVV